MSSATRRTEAMGGILRRLTHRYFTGSDGETCHRLIQTRSSGEDKKGCCGDRGTVSVEKKRKAYSAGGEVSIMKSFARLNAEELPRLGQQCLGGERLFQ